jgi:AraC family transcriptional regulator
MTPKITEKRRITLAGMDFYGNPYDKASGWSEENAIGRLWQRFMNFYQGNKSAIRNQIDAGGYEVWIDIAGEEESTNRYIFVGVAVERVDDLPLELVGKSLPETRYAVFTLKGEQIKSNWPTVLWQQWLPAAGLRPSFPFLIEYYDDQRFKGRDNPDSELDLYVPVP